MSLRASVPRPWAACSAPAQLGYYQTAFALPEELRSRLSMSLQRVLFPAFALVQSDHAAFQEGILRSLRLPAAIAMPICAGMAVLAVPIARTLYGDQWLPVVPLLQIVAGIGLLRTLQALLASIYAIKGRPDLEFRIGLAMAPLLVLAVVAGSRSMPTCTSTPRGHRRPKEIPWRDGVFDAATTGGVIFRAATELEANAIADVQAGVRRRLLRVVVRRGLPPRDDARAMGQWAHGGGFSVDGSVRIEAADRAGRERLLRYCARPPFALERLRELDPEHLIYDPPKRGPGGSGPQLLTPLELLDRLAAVGGHRCRARSRAPARKCPEKRAEQPVAAANRRLTRPVGASTPSLVRLK